MAPAPSSVGETRTSFTDSPLSWFCRLCARRPVGLHGPLQSLDSCARRVGDVARDSRCHLCRPARRGRALLVPPVRPPPLTIERRFMRRVAHRVRPREVGLPHPQKQLLLVLVVWAPPRKKRKQEQHALHGNRSPAGSSSERPTAS